MQSQQGKKRKIFEEIWRSWQWLTMGLVCCSLLQTSCSDATVNSERVILSLALTAPASTLAVGEQFDLTVTAKYSDDKEEVLTQGIEFSSSVAQVARVDGATVQALAPGSTTITAKKDNIAGTLVITVSPARLLQIAIRPTTVDLAVGQTMQLTATGSYSDSGERNITSQVSWSSSASSVTGVSTAGRITAVALGTATVSASLSGISQQISVTVVPPVLASLAINPNTLTLINGDTAQLTATGTMSNGDVVNLTNDVNWTLSDDTVASVVSTGSTRGLLTSLAEGQATIAAASGTVNAFAQLTVNPNQIVCVVPFYQGNPISDVSLILQDVSTITPPQFDLFGYSNACAALRCPPGPPCILTCPPLAGPGCEPVPLRREAAWKAWQGTNINLNSDPNLALACDPNNDSREAFLSSLNACEAFAVASSIAGGNNGRMETVFNPICRHPTTGAFDVNQPGCQPEFETTTNFYEGTCTVSACVDGKIGQFDLTLEQRIRRIVPVDNDAIEIDLSYNGRLPMKVIEYTASNPDNKVDVEGCIWSEDSNESIFRLQEVDTIIQELFGVDEGTATLTADCGGDILTKPIQVRIFSQSIAIAPKDKLTDPLHVAVDQTRPFAARATYLDAPGMPEDISQQCLWTSSDDNIVQIDDRIALRGYLRGMAPGTANITASCLAGDSNATLTMPVVVKQLNSVHLRLRTDLANDPMEPESINVGNTLNLAAVAYFADAPAVEVDITSRCFWQSSDASKASVIALDESTFADGVITGVADTSGNPVTISVICLESGIQGNAQLLLEVIP